MFFHKFGPVKRNLRHVAISGNIGSGKTELTSLLAKHYGWTPLYESVDKNPYLRDFYYDMARWAFHLQVYFLNTRFRQVRQIQESDNTVVQDRTIYEDAHIFANNLHSTGLLSERDYASYLDLYHSMIGMTPPPDLLIYLKADIPKLVANIQKRGRDFESAMSLEYLTNLNRHYEEWIASYDLGKVLTIDVNDLDFVERVEDFGVVAGRIDLELYNLFNQ
ncbi:MAG: deoxynucleoside kinase [Cyclobacteriaceae bacterium]|jgi:deoxyadenosine/deoxycytidine kinase|nr:deoxynucleoside kinase [Cyclobacteriaceae bacterium]